MDKLTVKVDSNTKGEKYIFVFLPDGTKLPRQTELSISDNTDGKALTVTFQYGPVFEDNRIEFKKGRYYFDGHLIPHQNKVRRPVIAKPFLSSLDFVESNISYFVGRFSCTDFDLA